MIDEWYDRAYLECRTELHAGIAAMISGLVGAAIRVSFLKRKFPQAGDDSCGCDPSQCLPLQPR